MILKGKKSEELSSADNPALTGEIHQSGSTTSRFWCPHSLTSEIKDSNNNAVERCVICGKEIS